MAENKTSFILYTDLINTVAQLPDEKAGQLFKIILEYVNDKSPLIEDLLLKIAFEPIKQQLKRDLQTWVKYKEKQSLNGKKGGRPRETQKTQPFFKEPKKAAPVTVTVTDTVNVNVNVNESDRVYFPPDLRKFFDEGKQWEETTCMSVVKCSLLEFKNYEQDFISEHTAKLKSWNNKKDAIEHFLNWTQKKHLNNSKNGKQKLSSEELKSEALKHLTGKSSR